MIRSVFRSAFQNYAANPLRSAVAAFLYLACLAITNVVLRFAANMHESILYAIAISFALLVAGTYWQIGFFRYHAVNPEETRLGLVFQGVSRLGAYVVLQLAAGFILVLLMLPTIGVMFAMPRSLAGLLLMLITTPLVLFFVMRLSLAPWSVVILNSDPFDAIQHSWRATRGRFWTVFAVFFLSALLVVGGLLLFVVGLLPAVSIATYAYRELFQSLAKSVH